MSGTRSAVDVGGVAHGALEARAFAVGEVEAEAHRVGHRQDVGEQDRRVEREARERLQRDFARELRVSSQSVEKTAGTGARRAVLGQVAAGLAHHPDRRASTGSRRSARSSRSFGERRNQPVSPDAPKTSAIVDCIASAAARGSAASRIGRPTTM